jgi:hypothetical protein
MKKRVLFSIFMISAFSAAGCGSIFDPTQKKNAESSPKAVRVSAPEIDAAEPTIAAGNGGGGSIFVVYVEHAKDKTADVFLQKFSQDLQPDGGRVRVNRQIGQAAAWHGDPPTVAVGQDGAIYVGWTARVKNEAGATGTDLMLSVSRDDGRSFDAPVKINDDSTPASHGMHSLAVDNASGRVYAAWLDERSLKQKTLSESAKSGATKIHHTPTPPAAPPATEAAEPNSEVFFAVSGDGGRTFSPNKKLAGDVCPCCKTSLAVAPDGGRLYVSWRQVLPGDFRHIAVASSADGGANFSEPTVISDDRWQLSACPVSGAGVTVDRENKLRVAWYTEGKAGQAGIYLTESADGGKTFAPRYFVRAGMVSGQPQIFSDGENRSRLLWAAGDKLFAETMNSTKTGSSNQEIGAGDLPAAAVSGDRIFAAFVKKEKETREIWLAALEN